jgi:predicted membrane-bound dolichyl-phosphate-mannose-protein mannosyltransferase
VTTGQKAYGGLRFWCLFLAILAIIDLMLMLVLVVLHAAHPSSVPVVVLDPLTYILAGSSAASVVLGTLWFAMRYPEHRKVIAVLVLITLGIMVAHLYTINTPPTSQCFDSGTGVQGCVMDEIYYVPAAQALLSGEKCGPYLDNCNLEHPFLGKAIIAAGIAIFGDTVFGWRFFVALLGTASIPVVFGICWKVSKDSTLSIFAAFLLAFETLFFVQSSIAVIDIQFIFFGLLAFLAYVANFHFWKFDRYIVSGILLALSALAKELAIFMVAFLVFYNLVFGTGSRLSRTISSAKMFAVTAILFCAGLELYVVLFGASNLHSFVGDIQYILSYGASLKCSASGCGWSFFANSAAPYITPFDWLIYYFPVGYDVVRVTVSSAGSSYSYVSVGYFGVPNWLETWFVWLWVPYVVYLGYKGWKAKRLVGPLTEQTTLDSPDVPVDAAESSSFRLARFALFWFLFTYLPYIFLFFYGRVTYPYYILSALPALAIGTAYLLSRKWFPREVAYIFLAGVFAWFFIFYPDKSFLPTQLRVLLGH